MMLLVVLLRMERNCVNEEVRGPGLSVEARPPLPAPICCSTPADHSQSALGKGETA